MAREKFGIHFVSMELRIWHKHCFVFIPSFHLHTHLHSRTPISIFARLIMPPRRDVMVCWHRLSIPDRHLVGTLCIIVILHAW
jgi:hypothetical protein